LKPQKQAFLERWSRLKREAGRQKPLALPAAEVDDALRRVALKKLFSDPRYNLPDPFDAYAGDWRATPIRPEMLAALDEARRSAENPTRGGSMLQRVMQDLKGDRIEARDGPIGSVQDVYFDDQRWAVRYLVVDTGGWLSGKKALISPASLPPQEGGGDYIRVSLTREQVRNAPGTGEDPPISRLLEEAHARYYAYPYYWAGPDLWGAAALPLAAPPAERAGDAQAREQAEQRARESHLRSGAAVVGYSIRALDGEVGHVEDFQVDDQSWAITGMVVDTRNWLPGKKVLVPPQAIADIDWGSRTVSVKLKRDELKRSPESG